MSSNSKRVVALAGLGTIGYHALDAILASKNWTPIILTRKSSSKSSSGAELNAPLVEVDYDDVESLTNTFKKHKVEVVVSFINSLVEWEKHVKIHANLIKASEDAGVKRFIPNEWGGDVKKYPNQLTIHKGKIGARDALAKSKLEYTLVGNGLFVDYLLPKGTKKYLIDLPIPVDPETHTARIPGDGNAEIIFTSADDLGLGLVWLLDQPKWDTYTYFRGEQTTWNKVLKEAEEITGKTFAVEYVNAESIKANLAEAKSSGNAFKEFLAEIDQGYAYGWLNMPKTVENAQAPAWEDSEEAKGRVKVRDMLVRGYASK